jgi:hypothetical protein
VKSFISPKSKYKRAIGKHIYILYNKRAPCKVRYISFNFSSVSFTKSEVKCVFVIIPNKLI